MDVIQINTTDKIGGAAKIAYGLYKSINNEGVNSLMYVGLKTSREFNIRIVNPVYNFLMHIPVLRKYVREYCKLGGFSKKDWIESSPENSIVHIHNLHGEYFNINTLKSLKNSGKKIVWTLHDMWLITANEAHTNDDYWEEEKINTLHGERKRVLQVRKNLLRDLDITYVLPSNWLNERFEKSILGKAPHLVINNGVEINSFFREEKSFAREALGLPQNKKVILFIAQGGRNNVWKGGDIWQYVVDNLAKTFKDVMFIELGRTKSDVWESENYLSAAYTDDIKTLRMYYSSANVLCFPSKAENYSLVLLEALACGLPVICFNVGGNSEIIENGENGYIVDDIDRKAFLDKLVKILDSAEGLEVVSKKNIKKSQGFSFDNMVRNYIKLYKSL